MIELVGLRKGEISSRAQDGGSLVLGEIQVVNSEPNVGCIQVDMGKMSHRCMIVSGTELREFSVSIVEPCVCETFEVKLCVNEEMIMLKTEHDWLHEVTMSDTMKLCCVSEMSMTGESGMDDILNERICEQDVNLNGQVVVSDVCMSVMFGSYGS